MTLSLTWFFGKWKWIICTNSGGSSVEGNRNCVITTGDGNRNCTNCTNCYDCRNCGNCVNRDGCRNCTNCTNCIECRNCTNGIGLRNVRNSSSRGTKVLLRLGFTSGLEVAQVACTRFQRIGIRDSCLTIRDEGADIETMQEIFFSPTRFDNCRQKTGSHWLVVSYKFATRK